MYPSQPGLKSLATGPRAMPYCPLGGGGIIPATGLTVAGINSVGVISTSTFVSYVCHAVVECYIPCPTSTRELELFVQGNSVTVCGAGFV